MSSLCACAPHYDLFSATKEKKAAAAKAGGAKKKKWSKGKVREKLDNAVYFTEEKFVKMKQEIPKMKYITSARVSDHLKCNCSLARQVINLLESEGAIERVVRHQAMNIYRRPVVAGEDAE